MAKSSTPQSMASLRWAKRREELGLQPDEPILLPRLKGVELSLPIGLHDQGTYGVQWPYQRWVIEVRGDDILAEVPRQFAHLDQQVTTALDQMAKAKATPWRRDIARYERIHWLALGHARRLMQRLGSLPVDEEAPPFGPWDASMFPFVPTLPILAPLAPLWHRQVTTWLAGLRGLSKIATPVLIVPSPDQWTMGVVVKEGLAPKQWLLPLSEAEYAALDAETRTMVPGRLTVRRGSSLRATIAAKRATEGA